ncbi:hypothetical protein B0H11DRAFT_2371466 [Mycena galericulata]|nr:hypothetical protein B0H11DRAFT_2371466 [Mycena galericulata]
MRFLRDTFYKVMKDHGLIVLQTSSSTLSLTEHIQNVVHELRNRQIDIGSSLDSSLLSHEDQPLAPLYIVNRGVPRPSDNQIRLRRSPVRPTSSLGDLAANRLQFAIPGLCIEPIDGENYMVTAFFALPGSGQVPRLHRCLSRRIYTMFPRDLYHPDGDSSCGESDDELGLDLDDDDYENLPPSPTPGEAPTRATTQPLPLPSPTSPYIPPLPSAIWQDDTPWHPNSPALYTTFQQDGVYLAATNGTPSSPIVYRGSSVGEAADKLLEAIGRCVDNGDFTSVLSDDHFYRYEPGSRSIVSSGEGILREVYQVALQKTFASGRQWLTPRADGKLSLLFIRLVGFGSGTFGPRQRMISIGGAMWSLMMIRGLAVDPIDTALLQLLFHECDLHSLHPTFIAEWHPVVKTVCDSWKAAGPSGNINTPLIASHLATYNDIEMASVETRDEATHNGLLVELLYRAVIGSEPPTHPDVISLSRGFRLPCQNGFTFTRYIRSFAGGSDRFLADIMASVVGPLTLITRLLVAPSPTLLEPIAAAMGGESVLDIFTDYFMGSGIPCPRLFEEVREHFPAVVDLSLIGTPNFRSQMWVWAVTGSPFLANDSGNISVVLVDDSDILYLGGRHSALLPALLASGTISFRTCFLEARIPASFLLRAAQASYTSSEPRSRRQYIHHWLLCQSLNGIASHTFG